MTVDTMLTVYEYFNVCTYENKFINHIIYTHNIEHTREHTTQTTDKQVTEHSV